MGRTDQQYRTYLVQALVARGVSIDQNAYTDKEIEERGYCSYMMSHDITDNETTPEEILKGFADTIAGHGQPIAVLRVSLKSTFLDSYLWCEYWRPNTPSSVATPELV